MKNVILMLALWATVTLAGVMPPSVLAAAQTQAVAVETVNINQADSLTLQKLPGVGPALAERIISYREAHGPFTSVEQLTEVKGVGQRKIEKFKDQLVLK